MWRVVTGLDSEGRGECWRQPPGGNAVLGLGGGGAVLGSGGKRCESSSGEVPQLCVVPVR